MADVVLIDREGLRNRFKTEARYVCERCRMKTCDCDAWCQLPNFLNNKVDSILDDQYVLPRICRGENENND